MSKASFVLFDCWDTVITYRVSNPQWMAERLLDNCDNTENRSAQEITEFFFNLMDEYYRTMNDFDSSIGPLLNYLCIAMGLKPKMSIDRLQSEVLEGQYEPEPLPGLKDIMDFLDRHGIGYAVASNTVYGAQGTKAHIDGCYPNNHLAFVMASSEVAVKKPNPRFFQTAAKIAGKKPADCIYIGDNFFADVFGSQRSGFHASVWYNRRDEYPPFEYHHEIPTTLKYYEIHEYHELLPILEKELAIK